MNVLAITQARIGSTRLHEKVLKKINGVTLLEIHLMRVLKSKQISKLKIATTKEPGSKKIISIGNKYNVETYKGSIDNVLERFYKTALYEKPDYVVRLTSDCPLIDPDVIDQMITFTITNNLDYASNTLTPTYPDGVDVEVFRFVALEKAMHEATLKSELEHVTPYIWKNSTFKGGQLFTSDCLMYEKDYSDIRLTVDTLEDFLVIEKLINILGTDKPWLEYVKALEQHPEIPELNRQFKRNEGYEKSLMKDTTNKNGKRTRTL